MCFAVGRCESVYRDKSHLEYDDESEASAEDVPVSGRVVVLLGTTRGLPEVLVSKQQTKQNIFRIYNQLLQIFSTIKFVFHFSDT